MHTFSPSRRKFLKAAAAASAGATVPLAANAVSCSPELLVLQERLLVARAERDRLHQIVKDVGGVCAADRQSELNRRTSALEAAESVVCDIEARMIIFEPRSIADLRLQVEWALYQEVIDYGMDERLPRLICERLLRLVPASPFGRAAEII